MCENGPAHVWLPYGRQTHCEHCDRVVHAFRRLLAEEHNLRAEVIAVEQDDLDAVIHLEGREIVLECLGYTQRDEFYDRADDDLRAKVAISDAITRAFQLRYNLRLHWQVERRRKGTGEVARVPRKRELDAFRAELCRLLAESQTDSTLLGRDIEFADGESVSRLRKRRRRMTVLDRAHWPLLANYCRSLHVDVHNMPSFPTIRSSADARSIGLDSDELRRTLRAKHGKLARVYRQRAAGRPVWLVIHVDGWPFSRALPEHQRSCAVALIADHCRSAANEFDAVWLLDGAAFDRPGPLMKVWPADT